MHGTRIGWMAVVASLSAIAAGRGSSSPVPVAVDGSGGNDAGDALPQAPDAGKLDGGQPADASHPGACPVPLAPDLSIIASNEVLNFVAPDAAAVEIATSAGGAPVAAAAFQAAGSLSLTGFSGLTHVLAQTTAAGCAPDPFDAVYDVRASYAPAPPDPATTAVPYDDPRIVGWATAVASYAPGPGATNPQFMVPSQALGPAGTDTLAVVSLGNGGTITVTFDSPIADGDGWEFAVYENTFASDVFL